MKPLHLFLLGALFSGPLHALDSTQLAAVARKFAEESGDTQYQARLELNRLVDQATAPGSDQTAQVNQLLLAALSSDQTPHEAKKYLIRILSKTGTPGEVPALTELLNGKDPLFAEEARRALERIPGPESVAALEKSLSIAKDSRTRIGLLNSLAVHRADRSLPLIRSLVLDPDSELARAAVNALGRIDSPAALAILRSACTSGKLKPAIQLDAERALLFNASLDRKTAARIHATTKSDDLRLAAFLAVTAGDLDADAGAVLETAIKSQDEALRHAAIRRGLETGLPSLQQGLAQAFDQLPLGDRLIVLANLRHLKAAEVAEKIALDSESSEDEAERIAALAALGGIRTAASFEAVLKALAAREPRINRTAASVISTMDYPEGDAILITRVKGESGDDKILAIKALAHRRVGGANTLLLATISGPDKTAAQEAMKSIFATASPEDLAQLCNAAADTGDADLKRKLTAVCRKIADRINTDEARKLVAPLE